MALLPKRLLRALLVLLVSVAPAPALADGPAQHVVSACDRGMFDLDCACVATRFEAAAQGASTRERQTLAGMTGVMLGIEPDPAFMDMSVIVSVTERLNALDDLTDACAAQPVPAGQLTEAAIDAEVSAVCARYPAPIDCGCVDTAYREAAEGAGLEQRQAIAELTIHNLNGAPPADLGRLAEINRLLRGFETQIGPLNEVAQTCATPASLPAAAPARVIGRAASALLQDVRQACIQSEFDLDCGCVGDAYSRVATGADREEQAGLARVAIASLGGENTISETPVPVLERIAGRMGDLMPDALQEACPAPSERRAAPACAQTAFVEAACRDSAFPLDCRCMADGFAQAIGALDGPDRAFVADVLVSSLFGTPQQPVSDYPPNRALANMDLADRLTDYDTGLARTCTDPGDGDLLAARRAGERVAQSPAAPVSGTDWRQAVRADCESFGNAPGLCACQAEVMGQHLSPRERELMGESFRSAGQGMNASADPRFSDLSAAELRGMQNRVNRVMSSERIQFEADLVCAQLR